MYVDKLRNPTQRYATLRRDYADLSSVFFMSTQRILAYSLRNSTQLYASSGVKAPLKLSHVHKNTQPEQA